MELREGYKNTEVGVIPKDWKETNLDELVKKNGLIRGPFGGSLKKEVFVESGIKVYEQKNAIYQTTEIGSYFIDEEKYKELNRFEIFENDFILSCSGTIGRIFRIPKNHPKGIINQALLIIRLNNSVIDFDYFYFQFVNEPFQKRIIDDTQGGAMKNLVGMSEFKKVQLPIPPTKAEQTAIANALSDTDALINSLEKLIAKKRNIKQGAMQKLLQPKEGWEAKKLVELTKIFTKQTGFDYTAYIKPSLVKYKTEETLPFIQNKDFNNKWINFDTDYYIPKSIATQFPNILLDEKSLLISISGSVGNIGVYESKKLAFIGGAVAILKFKEPHLIDWVILYLKSEEGQKKLLDNVKAGSHQNLILDDIRKIEILLPTKEEQTHIATILSDMDDEIDALETKLEKYKMLKLGMMQNLLTGKIRLV